MKKIVLALMISAFTPNVFASGFPTIDIANLIQQIQRYQQLYNQLRTLERQFDSMNGARGMGRLFNNRLTRDYIPEDIQDMSRMIDNTSYNRYSGINGAARAARDADRFFDEDNFSHSDNQSSKLYHKKTDEAYMAKALNEESYRQASNRIAVYQDMANRIDSASDPKAIADLQARIQAEQLMLQNEMIRLQAMQQAALAEQEVNKQREMQIILDMKRGENTGF